MLTTYLVNTAVDEVALDGMLSLREAVMAANSNAAVGDAPAGMNNGDRIHFDSSLNGATITLQQGELPILDDLNIDGFGRNITIDANGASRIFRLDTSETVRLANLELTGGAVDDEGGAIATSGGLLDLRRVAILDSTASGDGGGALFVLDGQVVIRDSVISGNAADGSSGSGGGLLINDGRVSVWNSEISGNTAVRAGGGIEIVDGQLTLNNVDLGGETPADGNFAGSAGTPVDEALLSYSFDESGTVASAAGSASFGAGNPLLNLIGNGGGAADLHGGAGSGVSGSPSDRALDNTASDGIIGASRGQHAADFDPIDALAAFTLSGWFKLPDTATESIGRQDALIENGTISVLDDPGGYRLRGGAVANSGTLELRVNRDFSIESSAAYTEIGEFVYFAVSYDGSGGTGNVKFYKGTTTETVTLVDTLTLNAGVVLDEAIPLSLGVTQTSGLTVNPFNGLLDNVRIDSSIVSLAQLEARRLVDLGLTPAATGNPGNGGGLHVTGIARVVINGGTVKNNFAASEGGGLWNQAGSTLAVRNGSIISDNIARGDAADNGGGGIFNNGGTLIVMRSEISNNTANGSAGSGGGVFSTAGAVSILNSRVDGNSANRAGGGVELIDGSLNIRSSSLSNNVTGPVGFAAPGNGGGLHVSGNEADVNVLFSQVIGNFAAREGGGLWNQAGSTMNVVGSTIQGNTASGDAADDGGGGIFNNGGTVNVLRSEISGNSANGAAGSGGGVFSTAGMVQITNTHIEDNTANRAGGGVEVVDGAIDLRFSWLSRNVAGPQGSASPGNGGGLHVSGNDAAVNVFFSQVIGNLAAREGGGLWNQAGSTMNVVGSAIRENRALGTAGDDGGGGIFNNGGIMELIFAQVERNFAAGNGGGIFNLAGGEMNVRGSNISDNHADDNGGGIYNDGDLLIQLSAVRRNDASDDGGGIFNDINGELDLALTLLFDNSPNNLSGPGTLI